MGALGSGEGVLGLTASWLTMLCSAPHSRPMAPGAALPSGAPSATPPNPIARLRAAPGVGAVREAGGLESATIRTCLQSHTDTRRRLPGLGGLTHLRWMDGFRGRELRG